MPPLPTRLRPRLLALALALPLLGLCGCGRGESTEPTAAAPTAEEEARIAADYLPAEAAPPAGAQPKPRAPAAPTAAKPLQERLNGSVHGALTLRLRMFVEKQGRMPESFGEFINSAMDSAPPAPKGMKFVIDPADQTVKVVRK